MVSPPFGDAAVQLLQKSLYRIYIVLFYFYCFVTKHKKRLSRPKNLFVRGEMHFALIVICEASTRDLWYTNRRHVIFLLYQK